jgi:predicted ABC-type transport system involved in lysophospholipase L1 biosynthesis ATPase subunit
LPERTQQARALVTASRLAHAYGRDRDRVVALRGVDLVMAPGERVAVLGRSGSGKTTLLKLLAGLETPSGGRLVIAGHDLGRMGGWRRDSYRRRVAGYVWQEPEDGLLPGLTALQNVLVPVLGRRRPAPGHVTGAMQLLDAVRLSDRLDDPPASLSPIEVERLALAVALANRPRLLLADELTARLDWPVARELLDDLTTLLDRLGTAAVLVTHDPRLAGHVDRVLTIRDGALVAAQAGPGASVVRQ